MHEHDHEGAEGAFQSAEGREPVAAAPEEAAATGRSETLPRRRRRSPMVQRALLEAFAATGEDE